MTDDKDLVPDDAFLRDLRDRAHAADPTHGTITLYPYEVTRLLDALATLTAERDAAVARAMPEARLIQTKEEAAQLPAGTYYVSPANASEGWFAVEALDTVSGPRWLYLDESDPRGDHMIAGCLVIRLPDLPTPTAGEPR